MLGFFLIFYPKENYKIFPIIWAFISIFILIAIPNFFRFSAYPTYCEAVGNLKAIYKMEKRFYSHNKRYAGDIEELGLNDKKLTRHRKERRYAYFLSSEEVIQPNRPKSGPYSTSPQITAFVEKDRFLIVAVGNIDNDATLDVWTIDEKKKLKNLVDDIRK